MSWLSKCLKQSGVELSHRDQQYRARLDFLCCSNDRVLVLRKRVNINMEKWASGALWKAILYAMPSTDIISSIPSFCWLVPENELWSRKVNEFGKQAGLPSSLWKDRGLCNSWCSFIPQLLHLTYKHSVKHLVLFLLQIMLTRIKVERWYHLIGKWCVWVVIVGVRGC